MFKKILKYVLMTFGILFVALSVYVIFFEETESTDDGFYDAAENLEKVYIPGQTVLNQGVIFSVDDAELDLTATEEEYSRYQYRMNIDVTFVNKIKDSVYDDFSVFPYEFRLFTIDGEEMPHEIETMNIQTNVLNGESAKGVLGYQISNKDEEEYILEYRSPHFTNLPKVIKYRLNFN